ncbi:MAG TPA: phosphoribosylformylglycinamidine synthase subunit PurL [Thermosulfidibacter takaii]|uniref:Phosphoribosylformylglycinamidine synthase subunit PurL n=1 Tax=Thermosulfidibacter takaii TaxID=412593 RepID=A0A7C0U6V7_9BACT|nr:phosphoribosylformylglycinamidine synthase subunit PurL [Thermosulfidibacter takaii]
MQGAITPQVIEDHNLTMEEYQRIVEILGREPNFTELGIISVMWSEHCSYKSSRVHLKKLPTQAPWVIQGPGENAGVIAVDDTWAVAFKMESHNHPSYIEPFQGAATGVGGILRDIFTMGARPIASLDSLRFGTLDKPRNRYILEGVVSGIAWYGNCIGVPTVGGEVTFAPCYDGNPLVNVFNLGLVRRDKIFKAKATGVGNPVIYVGSKTGRDGIHGATMASEEFSEDSEEKRPNVQVGDPFTEKLLMEACLEAFQYDWIVGIQDMGAAGLTCSTSEMASKGGVGIEIDLDRVPQREEGMTAYEIMLSESQERMLLVARKGTEDKVIEIFKKWGLDAVVIGRVTDDGLVRVWHKGEVVAEVPAVCLTEDTPVYDRPQEKPAYLDELQKLEEGEIPIPSDLKGILLKLLAHPNMANKRWIYRQYDHMVQINTIVLPGSDAAIIRIKDTGKAVALSSDCTPRYCYLDPYLGAQQAVAEAARNVACSGALPRAITNCLNFGNPEKPPVMWTFARTVEGMAEACRVLETPVTGGNVSFYNETMGKGIYPTPTIGMVGILERVEDRVTQNFKNPGDLVALLGKNRGHLGGTEYLEHIHGKVAGKPPAVDLEYEKRLHRLLVTLAREGLISSAHDVSHGGLAVTLAECCISGENPVGSRVELKENFRPDALLFGEDQGRVVLSLRPQSLEKVKALSKEYGVPFQVMGTVGGDTLEIFWPHGKLEVTTQELRDAWNQGLTEFLEK